MAQGALSARVLDKTTQKITVMVDNPYINGKYSVNIKKYDNAGNPMQYIVFKVNGKTLTATNAQGITTCVSEKAITKDDYQTADTYVIDEFKVNEKNYVKLSNKIKLTVKKGLNADGKKYVVKGIRLDEIDSNNKIKNSSETTDGTKVELRGIKLSDEKSTVTVVATLDKETQTITLGIPNKKVTGSYSMNLIKTTNNFKTPVQNVDFTWINSSNVKTSETTDTFGYIDIIDKYTITKENIEKTDSYTITEVEDASNKILELASNIVIRVSKTTESGKYVVNKVEVTCGDTKKTITRSDSANYVELTNLPTVNSVKTTTLKVTLDKTTQKITIYADNPTIDGKYNIKLKKTSFARSFKQALVATKT